MRTTNPFASTGRRALALFFMIILASLFVRATLVQAFAIPSGSMNPTLEQGDVVFVTPYSDLFRDRSPMRGDVIVFRSPENSSEFLTKRVVGLPGDHVEIRSGQVWLNGKPLDEPYVTSPRPGDQYPPEVLPEGRFFVLGDHRVDSVDSRSWGFLDEKMILGRARLIFWSRDEERNGTPIELIRWGRLLRPVR